MNTPCFVSSITALVASPHGSCKFSRRTFPADELPRYSQCSRGGVDLGDELVTPPRFLFAFLPPPQTRLHFVCAEVEQKLELRRAPQRRRFFYFLQFFKPRGFLDRLSSVVVGIGGRVDWRAIGFLDSGRGRSRSRSREGSMGCHCFVASDCEFVLRQS